MRQWPEVRTGRLLLRRWKACDREPFAAMNADPQVMRHFPATLTREESDRTVERFERRFDEQGYGLWALELLSTGEFVGFTGLNPMPAGVPGEGHLEVGWRLARTAWGHGYATEAARAAVRTGFEEIGLPELWSLTAVSNTRSEAVMRRLGMQRWGVVDHPAVPAGHRLRPHVLYRIVRAATASSSP